MEYSSPPPTYYSSIHQPTYSPEYHQVDSPTYSFSSSSSNLSRPFDDSFNTIIKREVLSPLPESFYDAYSHHLSTGLPLLTPPATEHYNLKKEDYMNQEPMLCCTPPPPPPPPQSITACYTPGCNCSLSNVFYNNGMISPNPMFYDNNPYNLLPPPPPSQSNYMHRPRQRISRHQSLDASSITTTEKTSNATPRRYKCTLCVKRFTRPSSLATHMHSHTGEKPYKCVIEGCGRRFSVVSNLRRHAKIHTHTP
ncbi:hypothetical protein BDF21DRAFT_369961 [Thamnidium elegans]|uniref:C2H2-type domain-containing protein n=1 Tax=Thamnidium elegans TaxID=101142 RepID=A0A8H7SP86_9FUNG|nr:hypothetical protein INT48_005663 [Thamnidium elegans]KAI8059760.1 hypothetical protein BDF21DRAFT_369961 [Thamnidium elegans]